MCEYSTGCTKVTDPMAKSLAESPRDDMAVMTVLCPKSYHLLATVYDHEQLGGLVLCQPHMKARAGSVFRLEPGDDPDRLAHWHPALTPLAQLGDAPLFGRCRCGTWSFTATRALEEFERVRAGTWEGIDPDTFVHVREDNTGKVFRAARGYVEKHLVPKGEHTIIGRAPGSDRLRRPYILSSYVQTADTH